MSQLRAWNLQESFPPGYDLSQVNARVEREFEALKTDRLDLAAFSSLMQRLFEVHSLPWKSLFDSLDEDGDGTVDARELM